ncbi:MAG TPA: S-adenosylmethionine:tRNA ribosyltransferase-isomerase [Cyclobacteriaceae bacterium]|nr:S-adenosylmethionine:tRNA ribosyltransferase-isomerase [Cyclobacteriaceae bacterium]
MPHKLPPIRLQDYSYELPDEKIARYPASKREQAKLMIYNKGVISHSHFSQLPDYLPHNGFLFFNDTKVIPARILFEKDSGTEIEVFLLNPVGPSPVLSQAMVAGGQSVWKCTIGNLKRWPDSLILQKQLTNEALLSARLIDRQDGLVEFTWAPAHLSFAEIIDEAGFVPLPPYIKRQTDASDKQRYQTVYSHHPGAVAAPTAGLHFTEPMLKELERRGLVYDFLTLHVSAGTFLPVKVENAVDHTMHKEQIIIRKSTILNLLSPDKKFIAVGTTAMRTLESLYWYGTLLIDDPEAKFEIPSLLPYDYRESFPTVSNSLKAVLQYMEYHDHEELTGSTAIFIFPGYTFKICTGLITNFHQPGSTLLLLIAAWLGPDWKKVYQEAMDNDYRFLSYGDSSLLLP